MRQLLILLAIRRRALANTLRTIGKQSILKIVVIAVLGSGFWCGLFYLFYRGFGFIRAYIGIETGVATTLLSLFFMSLTLMLIFSNGIISYTSFFKSHETGFLLSCPIDAEGVLAYKFLESLVFSSWAFFLLGIPLLLAYGINAEASWFYYVALVLFLIPFVVIPAALGALLAILLAAHFPRIAGRLLGWVISLAILGGLSVGLYFVGRTQEPFSYSWTRQLLSKIAFCHNAFLPSCWMTKGLVACVEPDLVEAGFDLLLLLGNAMFLCLVCDWVGRKRYRAAWSRSQSGKARTRKHRERATVREMPHSSVLALTWKDIRIFLRDPVQWSQCAILFGLLAIYIVNLRNLAYNTGQPMWRNLTAFLNLSATSLVLATLTTRFVYPLMSLEGRRFWILGLFPIKRSTILWSKFLFAILPSLLITEALIITSNLMLEMPPLIIFLHCFTVALVCVGLSGLSVGMSAIYPNLKEDNPSKIVAGFGGTLNLILSLTYVVAVITLEAIPCHLYFARQLVTPASFRLLLIAAVMGTVTLTCAAVIFPLWLGVRSLNRLQF